MTDTRPPSRVFRPRVAGCRHRQGRRVDPADREPRLPPRLPSRTWTSCSVKTCVPVRFQLELLKTQLVLDEANIASTFVMYGSARIPSPDKAEELLKLATDDEEPPDRRAARREEQILRRGARSRQDRQRAATRRGRQAPVRRVFGWRAVDHGGGEPRRLRCRRRIDRSQHRAAARTGAQPLRHAVAIAAVPLFRAAEDAFPAPRSRTWRRFPAGSGRSTNCSSC